MFASHYLCSAILILCVALAEATEPVRVIQETISLPTTTWPLGEGHRGHRPNRRADAVESLVEVEVIKLNNGIVEAWVALNWQDACCEPSI